MCDVLLIVLCGLPASGKTTFAKWLCESLGLDPIITVEHICYDAILRSELSSQTFESGLWKRARVIAFDRAAATIQSFRTRQCEQGKSALWVLFDDNMQLRSMRKQVCKLARKLGAGFSQLFFNVPESLALERNQQREGAHEAINCFGTLLAFQRHSGCPMR